MDINLSTLAPWSEVTRILSNAKSLTVKVGRKTYTEGASLSIDQRGNVTLELEGSSRLKASK